MNDTGHYRVTIAGCGPGAAEYLTPAVNAAVCNAEVLAGTPRLLVLFPDFKGEKLTMTADVSGFVDRVQEYAEGGRSVVVLVTGDPGLCSVARPLIERMGAANCRVIPGVSSLQAAFAELRRDWASARIINAHAGVPQIPFEPLADEETIAVLAGNRSAWQWVMGLARRLTGTHEVYKCSNLTLDGNHAVAVSLSELECMEEGGGTSVFVWVKIIHPKKDRQGKVYFTGAGPGDPELLTRKAEKLLRNCRCCIWAGSLVNPELLAFLPDGAVCYDSAGMTLDEILSVIERSVKQGVDVVRLHTGEPAIFGAIGEQMARLDGLGIDYEVVPGISSFQAAAAAVKCELTAPEVSQAVMLTRAPGRTPVPDVHTLEKAALLKATLCVFLSTDRIKEVVDILIPSYGQDCPAAVVYHASWPDQKVVKGSLADIAGLVHAAGLTRTGMIIVGDALRRTAVESKLYSASFAHGYRKAASGEESAGS